MRKWLKPSSFQMSLPGMKAFDDSHDKISEFQSVSPVYENGHGHDAVYISR